MAQIKLALFMWCLFSFICGLSSHNLLRDIKTESDPQILKTRWANIEAGAKKLSSSLVRKVIPIIAKLSGEIEVSSECEDAFMSTLYSLKELQLWAVRMLDATGKPSGGQLYGSLSNLGSHEECLSIQVPHADEPGIDFVGKYCLVNLRLPMPDKPELFFRDTLLDSLTNVTLATQTMKFILKNVPLYYIVPYRMGLCIPSVCSLKDIQRVFHYFSNKTGMTAEVQSCEIEEDRNIDRSQIAVICVICVFVGLSLVATALECVMNKLGTTESLDSRIVLVVQTFSLNVNIRNVFKPLPDGNNFLSCLHGLRLLSMGWVVLIHSYVLPEQGIYRDGQNAAEFLKSYTAQIIFNGSFSVDTFLFITGVLVVYTVLKNHEKHGPKVFNVPLLIGCRLWRLMPSAMMSLGLALLMPLLNTGPLWREETDPLYNNTVKYWWRVLLCINNFFSYEESPIISLWYISVDVQCFFLALVFLWLFLKSKKAGVLFATFLILASIISTALVIYFKRLLPTLLTYAPDKTISYNHSLYLHTLPHVHVCVYATGMLLGSLLATKEKIHLPKLLEIIGWPVALLVLYTTLHSTYIWNIGRAPTRPESLLYGSLSKIAWASGLAWITLMCSYGRGGFINEFLSWKVFGQLNRLSYLVYITHVLVITFFFASLRGIVDTHTHMVIWVFCGHLVLSFGIAFLMRIIFEAPLLELQRLLMRKAMNGSGKVKQVLELPSDQIKVEEIVGRNGQTSNYHTKM